MFPGIHTLVVDHKNQVVPRGAVGRILVLTPALFRGYQVCVCVCVCVCVLF